MSPDDQRLLWNSYARRDVASLFTSGAATIDEGIATAYYSAQQLAGTLAINELDTVLDIGAGLGFHGVHLAPLCKLWIGVDIADQMQRNDLARSHSTANLARVVTSGYDLACFQDGSVSVIYSIALFLHLEEWQRHNYFRESFRALRPGGRIYVESLSLESDDGWEVFSQITDLSFKTPETQLPIRPSTRAELFQYAHRSGFESVTCKLAGARVSTVGRKPQ